MPLPPEVAVSLDSKWAGKHSFVLGRHRLLTSTLLNKLYGESHSSPWQFSVFLLEALRSQTCTETRKATQVNIQAGRPLTAEEIFVDDVPGHFELWVRVRALFSSVAYVTVDIPAYFAYQDAETINDSILQWISTWYSGQRPPLDYFKRAYLATVQVFAEAVGTNKKTLSEIAASRSEWQHFWTQWAPITTLGGGKHSGSSSGGAGGGIPDPSGDLQRELDKARELVKKTQSDKDKQLGELKKQLANSKKPGGRSGSDGNWGQDRTK